METSKCCESQRDLASVSTNRLWKPLKLIALCQPIGAAGEVGVIANIDVAFDLQLISESLIRYNAAIARIVPGLKGSNIP